MEKLRTADAMPNATDPENFRVISKPSELIDDISKKSASLIPGEKLWIKGMYLAAGNTMDSLVSIMETSASNGTDVKLIADPISIYASEGIPTYLVEMPDSGLRSQRSAKSTLRATRSLIRHLQNHSGINFSFSSDLSFHRRIFPFAGADHKKGFFVGDTAYLTHANLDDRSFNNMQGSTLKITDPEISQTLCDAVMKTSKIRDEVFPVDSQSEVIVDSGKRNQSRIYETAIEMVRLAGQRQGFIAIDSGHHLIGGRLLKEVITALKNGSRVEIAVSDPDTLVGITYILNRLNQRRILSEKIRPEIKNAGHQKLHAKNLITDSEILVGSHNLVETGIRLGTREVALRTSNPIAIVNLQNYHNQITH